MADICPSFEKSSSQNTDSSEEFLLPARCVNIDPGSASSSERYILQRAALRVRIPWTNLVVRFTISTGGVTRSSSFAVLSSLGRMRRMAQKCTSSTSLWLRKKSLITSSATGTNSCPKLHLRILPNPRTMEKHFWVLWLDNRRLLYCSN